MPKLTGLFDAMLASTIRSSFRVRLFAGIAVVILIVATAFASLLFYHQYRSEADKRTSEGNLMAKLLARDVRLAVFSGERHQIANAISWAMALPEVQAIEVYDRPGLLLERQAKPVDDSSNYNVFQSIIPGLLNRDLEKSILVGTPWGGGDEASVGSVRVTINESLSIQRLHRLIFSAALTTVFLLAFGILAAFRLANSMTRPLTQLTACVSALKDGDDTVRAPVETNDEIGALATIFNSMVEAIRIRSKDLEETLEELYQLNIALEEKVSRRTAQLESANKELESFNYSASHDLRAPLTRLEGFCTALREDYGDRLDEQGLHYLDRIAATGEQMDRVLSALLTLYQLQQRTMTLKELNISELVQAVATSLQQRDANRKVTFSIQENIMVYGDMKLLWLALENLIGNAWKFTGGREDARIEFGTTEIKGELVCYLRDNGTGFDMSYYDKLFIPFQRLHNQQDFPGSGVGLAIVQRIISRHEGRIWLESKEKQGTTCYFVLPRKPAGAASAIREAA